jgi:hypothetical protein
VITNIDMTSLYGLVQALTTEEPTGWARRSYYDVALTLLLDSGVRVPPPYEAKKNVLRIMIDPIQQAFGTGTRYRAADKERALLKAQSVARTRQRRIRQLIDQLSTFDDFRRWRHWHMENEWIEHIEHFNGLVEASNIPLLAEILRRPSEELREANEQAAKEPERTCSDPDELHHSMDTADVLVRGLYYDELARSSHRRVVLHPVRRAALEGGMTGVEVPYEPVLFYLVAIVGNAAYEQRGDQQTKVRAWTENICKCREQYAATRRRRAASDPRDAAVEIAKKAGTVRRFRWADTWAERIAFGGGVAAATGLIVIDRYLPGLPVVGREALAEVIGLTVHRRIQEGTSYFVKTIGESRWALEKLADKGKWFSGRVFSYDEAEMQGKGSR